MRTSSVSRAWVAVVSGAQLVTCVVYVLLFAAPGVGLRTTLRLVDVLVFWFPVLFVSLLLLGWHARRVRRSRALRVSPVALVSDALVAIFAVGSCLVGAVTFAALWSL